MEEKSHSMGMVTLGYAVILGIVVIMFSLLLFVLDVDRQSALNYFSYVFVIAGLIFFQINYRNKYMGGFISYGKAFTVGLLIIVWYSIIMAIFTYIFFIYIDPGAVEEIRQVSEQQMMERGMSDQEIDQAMKFAGKFQTPFAMTLWALIGGIVVGIIISLITSIFVKKEDQSAMPAA
jgi:hypothetical protein